MSRIALKSPSGTLGCGARACELGATATGDLNSCTQPTSLDVTFKAGACNLQLCRIIWFKEYHHPVKVFTCTPLLAHKTVNMTVSSSDWSEALRFGFT
jgi:hypothetical protein